MENKKILRYASLGMAAVAMIAQTLAVILQYDVGANYFQNAAVLPTVALVAALIAAALGTMFAKILLRI